ncbi:hypothetical protein Tco_1387363 [Tanacetum coccineum]
MAAAMTVTMATHKVVNDVRYQILIACFTCALVVLTLLSVEFAHEAKMSDREDERPVIEVVEQIHDLQGWTYLTAYTITNVGEMTFLMKHTTEITLETKNFRVIAFRYVCSRFAGVGSESRVNDQPLYFSVGASCGTTSAAAERIASQPWLEARYESLVDTIYEF